MSAAAGVIPAAAVNATLVRLLATGGIFFGVFLSGFVIREPAPYEIYMAGLMAVWGVFGLRLSRGVTPLLALLIVFNIGGMIAMTQMADLYETPLYLAVSLFLGMTAVFFAAILEANPGLYRVIFTAWIWAAVATAILGIAGYFHAFPGAEMFTLYDRAAGAFQDPNVFGPFLALPGIFLIHQILTGDLRKAPLLAIPMLIIVAGIFFSFSRGAWGLFAFAAMLMVGALFLRSNSNAFRLRIIMMGLVAFGLLIVALLVLFHIPGVSEMFTTRARLVQDYDSERLGRFARHFIGLQMAMEKPLGIGALNFGRLYGEDTHDIWLKALLDYGWLGFASYLLMIVWTLATGFKILFRARPWQPYLLCAYVVLIGHIALGTVIDTDHWRHFYLLLGLIWGAIALEVRHGFAASRKTLEGKRSGKRLVGVAGFEPTTP